MKQKILKTSTIFLLLIVLGVTIIGAGCQKENDIFEIQIGDKSAVIQKEVNGIEFKFCLLNEQGEPATVFNEGENFSFLFSITNKSGKKLYLDNSFFDKNFCNVHNTKGNDFGKPYETVFIYSIGQAAMPLSLDSTYTLSVPWKDDRESWSSLYYSFKGLSKDLLPSGKYFTEFSHQFSFSSIKTDLLIFRINFEIK